MTESAVASKDFVVREALLAYLSSIKEFYKELYSPIIIAKMEALFPAYQINQSDEPFIIRLARTEKWWLTQFFSSLSTIDKMFRNIECWRTWFLELVESLEFTEKNIKVLMQTPDKVLKALKKQKMDEGYVRLVVKNATNDFLEYVKDTRTLLDKLVKMNAFIQSLESPVLKKVELRLQRIKDVNYQQLLLQMQQLLAAAYNAPTQTDFLRNLASLLYIFAGWREIIQLDDTTLADPKGMDRFVKEMRKLVDELAHLTHNFQGFVEARSLSDYYIRQAELSTIRMMLSYEGTAEKWWLDFIMTEPARIPEVIPKKLDPNQLLIGVTNSLALLEDLEQRLNPKMPTVKTTIGLLAEFLESPALQLYQEINQSRIILWESSEKQMVSMLVKLRTALHDLIKQEAL